MYFFIFKLLKNINGYKLQLDGGNLICNLSLHNKQKMSVNWTKEHFVFGGCFKFIFSSLLNSAPEVFIFSQKFIMGNILQNYTYKDNLSRHVTSLLLKMKEFKRKQNTK